MKYTEGLPLKDDVQPLNLKRPRTRSSLGMKYDAEVAVIQRKLGGLENIRKNLGLSQRKICQILMVDPSAWTRWTSDNDKAPPYVYRMLELYMALNEKLPEITTRYYQTPLLLESLAHKSEATIRDHSDEVLRRTRESDKIQIQNQKEIQDLRRVIQDLETKVSRWRRSILISLALGAASSMLVGVLRFL